MYIGMIDKTLLYYLCGPMTGYPNNNYEEFEKHNYYLTEYKDFHILSPTLIHPNPSISNEEEYIKVLKEDLAGLFLCKGIILLDGWEKSRGATLEHYVARSLGYKILTIRECYESN